MGISHFFQCSSIFYTIQWEVGILSVYHVIQWEFEAWNVFGRGGDGRTEGWMYGNSPLCPTALWGRCPKRNGGAILRLWRHEADAAVPGGTEKRLAPRGWYSMNLRSRGQKAPQGKWEIGLGFQQINLNKEHGKYAIWDGEKKHHRPKTMYD